MRVAPGVCVSLVTLAIPFMSRFLHRAEWSVRLGFGMDEMSAVELDGRAPGGSRPSRSSQGRGAQAAANNAASSVTGLGFACLLPWFVEQESQTISASTVHNFNRLLPGRAKHQR